METAGIHLMIGLYRAIDGEIKSNPSRESLKPYVGVIHHHDAFLISIERIVEYITELQNTIFSPDPNIKFPKLIIKPAGGIVDFSLPPMLVGISSKYIEIEVENLLLRCVSLLERISGVIASECNILEKSSFFKLDGLLCTCSDPRSQKLLNVLRQVKPVLENIVVSIGNQACLRNVIAHRASSPEIMESGFSLNWYEKDKLLAFDAELQGIPLIGTVVSLARVIPYYVFETLRILMAQGKKGSSLRLWADGNAFSEDSFKPSWKNPFIHYSDFIDDSKQGKLVSVVSWDPGGFHTHQDHLKDSVFDLAVGPVMKS